jgi:predicted AAA+ superfamily ATPase
MKSIPEEQVERRLFAENGWWGAAHGVPPSYADLRRRAYFASFFKLLAESEVRRAVLLMGPRRVGKTVMMHHAVAGLLTAGVAPKHICYVSIDHPIYTGRSLEDLLDVFAHATGTDPRIERCFLFFDEIQYLRDWETHLKALVDSYPALRLTASGSAAAALRLKSTESGAGRFTEFLLPPLTFQEYLDLLDANRLIRGTNDSGAQRGESYFEAEDIHELNRRFVHYLNYGGYPEVLFSAEIQADPGRFVKGDIIDKVLLRDLPSLYGIQDVQELNYLFTTLAFNTADEISLESLSKGSGVAKNTIKRYIEYLQAAFLIKAVHRIDRSGRRFQRANFFKVYLTNPSIRSALFAPISGDDEAMGALAETGIFSQWFHSGGDLHYARWQGGEVDIVQLGPDQKPMWAVEVKWTDRYVSAPHELRNVITFCRENDINEVAITTRSRSHMQVVEGIRMTFVPASLYCYTVGYNVVRGRQALIGSLAQSSQV